MKKLHTDKKLLQYAASAVAFLMVNDAGAAIVYTDLDPDLTIGGEGAEATLDINADGTDDFTFILYNYAGTGTYYGIPGTFEIKIAGADALNNNEFLGSVVTNSGYTNVYVPVLAPGEGINEDDNFASGYGALALIVNISAYGIPFSTYETGVWLDTEMEFLGFRLKSGDDFLYGWMRISVNADATQLIIHDYAYEDEANKSIFTGSTASAIEENLLSAVQIFANGDQLNIEVPVNISTPLTVKVIDLTGKEVKTITNVSGNNSYDCSDLASANYLIQIADQSLHFASQVHLGK